MGLRDAGGAQGVKNVFKHGHVAYPIDGDNEQNRKQGKFSSKGQTGDLGVRAKGQISLNFGLPCQFQRFLSRTLCMFSQIKKYIELNFYSVAGSCPWGGTWRCWGSKTLAWGFAMAPH